MPVATAPTGAILENLRVQKLPGYDAAVPLPSHGDIVIAVIGTGISSELSNLLGARLVHSSSTVPNESDTDDRSGHGTAVISLVAALAPTAKIVSIKTFSREGTGSNYSIMQGIVVAISEGAKVILLPFGSPAPDEALQSAVKDALNKGVLVVAPAGNTSANELIFPARITGVLAVGAVDTSDKLASFTNRGPNLLYAPGVDILVLGKDGILVKQSGTSFSATVAAAVAAAIWAGRPDLIPRRIRELLLATSVDLGPVDQTNPALGELRRIDAIAALHGAS
jgi:subtilisin family serine protease